MNVVLVALIKMNVVLVLIKICCFSKALIKMNVVLVRHCLMIKMNVVLVRH